MIGTKGAIYREQYRKTMTLTSHTTTTRAHAHACANANTRTHTHTQAQHTLVSAYLSTASPMLSAKPKHTLPLHMYTWIFLSVQIFLPCLSSLYRTCLQYHSPRLACTCLLPTVVCLPINEVLKIGTGTSKNLNTAAGQSGVVHTP